MSTWTGKFLVFCLAIILIALVILLFRPNQSPQTDATKGKSNAAPAGQDTPRPLPAVASNPALLSAVSGSMSDTTPDQQNLQRELEELAASQAYKDMLARQARGEQLTQADLELLLKASDIKGKMVRDPSLAKSTKYPPEDAKTQEMWQWWRRMKAADRWSRKERRERGWGKDGRGVGRRQGCWSLGAKRSGKGRRRGRC